jgi:hypothetical protein
MPLRPASRHRPPALQELRLHAVGLTRIDGPVRDRDHGWSRAHAAIDDDLDAVVGVQRLLDGIVERVLMGGDDEQARRRRVLRRRFRSRRGAHPQHLYATAATDTHTPTSRRRR